MEIFNRGQVELATPVERRNSLMRLFKPKASQGELVATRSDLTYWPVGSRSAQAGSRRSSGSVRAMNLGDPRSVTSVKVLSDHHPDDYGSDDWDVRCKWVVQLVSASDGKVRKFKFTSPSRGEAHAWVSTLSALSREVKPIPVVAVLGQTGAGKSTFSRTLTGMSDRFQTGASADVVTDRCDMATARWFGEKGEDARVVVVDTPGLDDPRPGRDNDHLEEIVQTLRDVSKINTFAIVVNGHRLTNSMIQMLRVFERFFGVGVWSKIAFIFTHWDKERSLDGSSKLEALQAWNGVLRKYFSAGLDAQARANKDVTCFFMDLVVVKSKKSEDRDWKAASKSELDAFRTFTVSNHPFPIAETADLSGLDLNQLRLGGGGPEGGDASTELMAQLRFQGLEAKAEGLREQGITTRSQFLQLRDQELALLGWSARDIERVKVQPDSADVVTMDGSTEQLLKDLRSVGIANEKALANLKANGHSVRMAVQLSLEELKQFGFRAAEWTVFETWRNMVLLNRPVFKDGHIAVGDFVMRGGSGWTYSDDPLPQDGWGSGVIKGWRSLDGQAVSPDNAPDTPGYCCVRWLVTGYRGNYRIGADNLFDLHFADRSHFDLAEQTDDLFSLTEEGMEKRGPVPSMQSGHGVGAPVVPSELRCRFGWSQGLRYAHWSNFDTRDDICMRVGGMRHGDVLRHRANGSTYVAIGAKLTDVHESVVPWLFLQPENATSVQDGAGILTGDISMFEPTGERRNLSPKDRNLFKSHEDGGIANDTRAELKKTVQADFSYNSGVRLATPALFDVRDEATKLFGLGFAHGDRVQDQADGEYQTCIGIHEDNDGFLQLWFHVDGRPGAGINRSMHMNLDRFEKVGRIQVQEAEELEVVLVQDENAVAALRESLKQDFIFPLGIVSPDDRTFDTRPGPSLLLCGYAPGTVLIGPDQKKLVVIGVRVDEDDGEVTQWFHHEDSAGAGRLLNWNLIKGAFQAQPRPVDLAKLGKDLRRKNRQSVSSEASPTGGPEDDEDEDGLLGLLRALLEEQARGQTESTKPENDVPK